MTQNESRADGIRRLASGVCVGGVVGAGAERAAASTEGGGWREHGILSRSRQDFVLWDACRGARA